MRKTFAVVLLVFFSLSLFSLAFAAEMKKGTVRGVDMKAGTITFCPEGTTEEHVMTVDKAVDLGKVAKDTKVEITVDKVGGKDVVKDIKTVSPKMRKAIEGC
jgi:Cu/Ag efflux protein CusF